MSIEPGDDIGLEIHQGIDQFLRSEIWPMVYVKWGRKKEKLPFVKE